MTVLLDKPLFPLKPDSPRLYANVSNALEIVRGGEISVRHIQVGASLLTLMRTLKVPQSASVTLYLDIEKGRAIFGLVVDNLIFHDLWDLPVAALPPFTD